MKHSTDVLMNEYDSRIRALEESLKAEQGRHRLLAFRNRQLNAQITKFQRENFALGKELKERQKCANCSCLDERRKQRINLHNLRLRNSKSLPTGLTLPSTSGIPDNFNTVTNAMDINILRTANERLQNSISELQCLLKKKTSEAVILQHQYEEQVRQRERVISMLTSELEASRRKNFLSHLTEAENALPLNQSVFYQKERNELLKRVKRLEEQLRTATEQKKLDISRMMRVPDASSETQPELPSSYCQLCNERSKALEQLGELTLKSETCEKTLEKESISTKQLNASGHQPQEHMKNSTSKESKSTDDIISLKARNDELFNECNRLKRRCDILELELAKSRLSDRECLEKKQLDKFLDERTARHANYQENFISRLPNHATERIHCSRHCQKLHAEREDVIHQLETDIAILMEDKNKLKQTNLELVSSNDILIENEAVSRKRILELEEELNRIKEREAVSEKKHMNEIQIYQGILHEKEVERAAFIDQLYGENRSPLVVCDSVGTIRKETEESLELKRLNELKNDLQASLSENEKIRAELTEVKHMLSSTNDRLLNKQKEIEQEIMLKNSMHDDLADARRMLLEKENELRNSISQLRICDIKVLKLETELANCKDRLNTECASTATLKSAVEELEEILRQKSQEIVTLQLTTQKLNRNSQILKETIYDLETKLALKDRDLKSRLSQLAELRQKLQQEQDLLD